MLKMNCWVQNYFYVFIYFSVSYLLFYCYICEDIHGWFGCVIIAEDISEI